MRDDQDADLRHVDLREAAAELGVHYQTAYRWVRTGRLPAQFIDGRYVIDRSDIVEFATQRSTPRVPTSPTPKRIERASDRVHDALVSGDEALVRQISLGLVDEGTTIVHLVQDVLVPPLIRIGAEWHAGRLEIWVEHRASAIVERLLGELAPNPRGRRRGTVMVAAVAGDFHSLPTTMASVVLRADNWAVEHLGSNMPTDELVRFCDEHEIDVAVLSSTNPETMELAAETADRLRRSGTPTVLGGPGRMLTDLLVLTRAALAAT